MSDGEKIGLKAALETPDFTNGVKVYLDGINKINAANLAAVGSIGTVSTAMARTAASVASSGAKAQTAAAAVAKVGTTAVAASSQIRQVETASTAAGRGLDWLQAKTTALGVAMGNIATQAVNALGNALIDVGRTALNATAYHERLSMALEAMAAREILNAGAAQTMAEALDMAAPRAQELLRWTQQLAIESPFSQEDVNSAFRTALAYGFTTLEAQRLTQDMIDLASATGNSGFMMDRISLALGQMRGKSKVTSGELKQLTEAGVDVTAILASIGKSLNDVADGTVRADDFIEAFADTIERDFGGAAKRQAGTLTGLINSLQDIQQVGLRELFGGMFQAVQPELQAFTTGLQASIPTLAAVGNIIGQATRYLLDHRQAIAQTVIVLGTAVGAFLLVANASAIMGAAITAATVVVGAIGTALAFLLSPIGLVAVAVAGLAALFVFSFTDIEEKTGNFFAGMGNDLFSFGHNIIVSLANGMAAAASAVVDVLISIGNIIASWLAPGSPPRLLPDLDTWGTGAINAYLSGWTKGDFSLFRDVAGTIEGYLRSLGEDIVPETDLIPRLLGTRSAIEQAIAQMKQVGTVSEAAFQEIYRQVGITNPAIQSYVRSMFELERANIAAERAQAELNAITARYQEQLKPIDAELQAIQDRRQEVVDQQRTQELEAILSDENAPALAKELAQMELREIALKKQRKQVERNQDTEEDAARTRLEEAQAAQRLAAEQMAAQRALVEHQSESNRLMKEQLKLLERLANQGGAAGGGAGGIGGGGGIGMDRPSTFKGIDVSGIGGAGGAIDSVLSGPLADLEAKLRGFWEEVSAPFAPLQEKLETLRTTWGTVFAAIIGHIQAAAIALMVNWYLATTQFKAWIDENVIPALTSFGTWLTVTLPEQIGQGIAAIASMPEVWRGILENIGTIITATGASISEQWSALWLTAQENAAAAWTNIQTSILTYLRNLFASMGLDFDNMVMRWSLIWSDVLLIASTLWMRITEAVSAGITSVQTWLTTKQAEIQTSWNTFWESVNTTLSAAWTTANTAITDATTTAKATLDAWLLSVQTEWNRIWTEISTALTTTWDGIKATVDEKVAEVYASVTGKIEEIKTWIDGQVDNFKTLGGNIINGVKDGVLEAAGDLIEAVTQAIEDALNAAKQKLGIQSPSKEFAKLGVAMGEGAVVGLDSMTKKVQGAINEMMGAGKVNKLVKAIAASVAIDPMQMGRGNRGVAPNTPIFQAETTKPIFNSSVPNRVIPAMTRPRPMQASPAMLPPLRYGNSEGGGMGNSVSVDMGGVSITTPMDEQLFEARVRRIINDALSE